MDLLYYMCSNFELERTECDDAAVNPTAGDLAVLIALKPWTDVIRRSR